MKIFIVDQALNKMGGVERVLSTLANEFSKKFEVNMCSIYRHRETPFFYYSPDIKFTYLIDLTRALSTLSRTKIGFIFFRALEKVIEIFVMPIKIKNVCDKMLSSTDVIVLGRIQTALKFLPYLEQFQGKIIIRDASHMYFMTRWQRGALKHYFLKGKNVLIVSSDESKNEYLKLFGDDSVLIKKIYNPLGIEYEKVNALNNKVILGAGRYMREKGFENLINAYALVTKEHPEWKLSLIGSGEDYKKYKKLCAKLDILENVEFHASNNIVQEYEQAGIFIMSSRTEGYANALVEAMACGLPVISYDWLMGVTDIIQDGINGIVVPLQDRKKYFKGNNINDLDVKNLALAICKLIEDENLRSELSKNAIKIRSSRQRSIILDQWYDLIYN